MEVTRFLKIFSQYLFSLCMINTPPYFLSQRFHKCQPSRNYIRHYNFQLFDREIATVVDLCYITMGKLCYSILTIVSFLRLVSGEFLTSESKYPYLPDDLQPQKYDLDFVTTAQRKGPKFYGKVIITVCKIHDQQL